MEDGNVWFYAALVVIAFISWVVGKVREAIENFRERQEYKDRPVRTDIGPPPSSPAQQQAPPPPRVSQKDRAKEAMRETYRALGIPFPEDEPPQPPAPPVRSRPPSANSKPSKVAPVVAAEERLTADERKALNSLQQRRNAAASSSGGEDSQLRSSAAAKTLRRLLRSRKAIRQAILLKEILDQPKSLRSDSH